MSIKIIIAIMTAAIASAFAAQSIEFTYFYPDRYQSSSAMVAKWGERWQWPIKTFPPMTVDYGGYSMANTMDRSYGLVYWPGETVNVEIIGNNGQSTGLHIVSLLTADTLPWTKTGADAFTIPIPNSGLQAPYLQVYRVHAFNGATEIASRGLIVTIPWSGWSLIGKGDPRYFNVDNQFSGANNPSSLMTFQASGIGGDAESRYPMRNRAWHSGEPMHEIEWNYASQTGPVTQLTTDNLSDSTLEWGRLWYYYGQGAGNWNYNNNGSWLFGPFSGASVTRWDGSACYGNDRRISTVLPNGLLWNQNLVNGWLYGIYRRANQTDRTIMSASDCNDGPFRNSLDYTMEVGTASLYYKRSLYNGQDIGWSSSNQTYAQFVRGQDQQYASTGSDFETGYLTNEINTRNMYMEKLQFPAQSRQKFFGQGSAYSGYQASAEDDMWIGGIGLDQRPTFESKWDLFKDFVVKCGEDRMHTQNWRSIGAPYYRNTRNYRSFGLHGAVRCAIFPTTCWGPGYNFTNGQPGSMMPGGAQWNAMLPLPGYNDGDMRYYANYMNDGTSFRRWDIFDRVAMFWRPSDRRFHGHDMIGCLGDGGNPSSEASETQLWNVQALLGEQVMEIPDRLTPIGGVLIIDSNNKGDRLANHQYETDKCFADYCAAMMDSLGIVAYANPDAAASLPSNIPRIHMVKRNGSSSEYMLAEIGTQQVAVQYPQLTFYWYSGADTAWNPIGPNNSFAQFVTQVKATYKTVTGESWPIQATGGFAATAWESSKGVWVYVENPMQDSGVIHTARTGSVTVKVRGLNATPAVIDLCGYDPDPNRVADSLLSRAGEFLTIKLNWQMGDARLFYVDFTPPVKTIRLAQALRGPSMRMTQMRNRIRLAVVDAIPYNVSVLALDGRRVREIHGIGPGSCDIPLSKIAVGTFIVHAECGGENIVKRFVTER